MKDIKTQYIIYDTENKLFIAQIYCWGIDRPSSGARSRIVFKWRFSSKINGALIGSKGLMKKYLKRAKNNKFLTFDKNLIVNTSKLKIKKIQITTIFNEDGKY